MGAEEGGGGRDPSFLGTPRAAPCSLKGALHTSGTTTAAAFEVNYTLVIRRRQASSTPRQRERPLYSGAIRHGKSTGPECHRPAARGGTREKGGCPRAQGEGGGRGDQRRGVPLGAAGAPGAVGGEVAVLREDPVPGPRRADPPGGVRPGRLGLPVLRAGRRERRPRDPPVQGRGARLEQRAGGVP